MGRLHADFYPLQAYTPLAEVETFRRFLGGFAGNVGVGLARLGVSTAVVSGVGDDGHGAFILEALRSEGVAVDGVFTDPQLRTALTFCEIWPPDHFPLTPYRLPTCPDWEIRPTHLDSDQIRRASLFFVSGTGLAQDPSRSTTLSALNMRREAADPATQVATILDLDWRPGYWVRPDEYPRRVRRALGLVDTVIGSDAEFAAAAVRPADLIGAGLRRVFVKHGPDGATLIDGSATHDVPATPTDVVNGLGAGDAFAAAVGWGLLRGQSAEELLRHAGLAGAIVAGRLACAAAMPYADELLRPEQPRRPDPSLPGRSAPRDQGGW